MRRRVSIHYLSCVCVSFWLCLSVYLPVSLSVTTLAPGPASLISMLKIGYVGVYHRLFLFFLRGFSINPWSYGVKKATFYTVFILDVTWQQIRYLLRKQTSRKFILLSFCVDMYIFVIIYSFWLVLGYLTQTLYFYHSGIADVASTVCCSHHHWYWSTTDSGKDYCAGCLWS